ncbi:hypothetical protein BZA77DRAFT_293268 [Pyronema omphalodes]|nr:hypothetical protein BZA77DRAFT_293268 [Pyronema omphalodes]
MSIGRKTPSLSVPSTPARPAPCNILSSDRNTPTPQQPRNFPGSLLDSQLGPPSPKTPPPDSMPPPRGYQRTPDSPLSPKTLPPYPTPVSGPIDTPYRITTPLSSFEKQALSSLSSSFPVDLTPKPTTHAKPKLRVITKNLSNFAERCIPDILPIITASSSRAEPMVRNNSLEAILRGAPEDNTKGTSQVSTGEQMYGRTTTGGELYNLSTTTAEVENHRARLQQWVQNRPINPAPECRRFARSFKRYLNGKDKALSGEQEQEEKEIWDKGYAEGFREGFLWCSMHNHSQGQLEGGGMHSAQGSQGSNSLGNVTMPRPEDFIAGPHLDSRISPAPEVILKSVPYCRRDSDASTLPVFTPTECDSRDGEAMNEEELNAYYSRHREETEASEHQAGQEERPPHEAAGLPYPLSPPQLDTGYQTPPLHQSYRVDPHDLINRLSQVSLHREVNIAMETPIADIVYPLNIRKKTPDEEVPEEESEWCYISQHDQPGPPMKDRRSEKYGEGCKEVKAMINEMITDINNPQTQTTWATPHTAAGKSEIHNRGQGINYRNPHALTTARLTALNQGDGVMESYAAGSTLLGNPEDSSRRTSTSDGGSYNYPYPRPSDSMARSTTTTTVNLDAESLYAHYRAGLQRLEEIFGRRSGRGTQVPRSSCTPGDASTGTEKLDQDYESSSSDNYAEGESDFEGTAILSSPTVPHLILRGGMRSPIESSDGSASPTWPANAVIRENRHAATSVHVNIEESLEEGQGEAWEKYNPETWDNSGVPEQSLDDLEWSPFQAALPLPVQNLRISPHVEPGQEQQSKTNTGEEADDEAENTGDEDDDWEVYNPERWGTTTITDPITSDAEVTEVPVSALRAPTNPVSAPEDHSPLTSAVMPVLTTSTAHPETINGSSENLGNSTLQDQGSENADGSSNVVKAEEPSEYVALPRRDFSLQLQANPSSNTAIAGPSTLPNTSSDSSRQDDITRNATPARDSRNTTRLDLSNHAHPAVRRLWQASSTPIVRNQPRTHLTSDLRYTPPYIPRPTEVTRQVDSDSEDEEGIRGHVRHSSVDQDWFDWFVPPPPTPQYVRDRIRISSRNYASFLSARNRREREAEEANTDSADPDVVRNAR